MTQESDLPGLQWSVYLRRNTFLVRAAPEGGGAPWLNGRGA